MSLGHWRCSCSFTGTDRQGVIASFGFQRSRVIRKSGPMNKDRRRAILFLLIGLWLCAVGVGLKYLWTYEVSAGTAATPAGQWPEDSRIKHRKDQATLVL